MNKLCRGKISVTLLSVTTSLRCAIADTEIKGAVLPELFDKNLIVFLDELIVSGMF